MLAYLIVKGYLSNKYLRRKNIPPCQWIYLAGSSHDSNEDDKYTHHIRHASTFLMMNSYTSKSGPVIEDRIQGCAVQRSDSVFVACFDISFGPRPWPRFRISCDIGPYIHLFSFDYWYAFAANILIFMLAPTYNLSLNPRPKCSVESIK